MLKKYEIQCVSRLREQKEYYNVKITAESEISALQKFSKKIKIGDYRQLLDDDFSWWDNEWLTSFKCIIERKKVVCPCCNGTGRVDNAVE